MQSSASSLGGLSVTIVNACLRDGTGGSPTAVLLDTDLTDSDRRAIPSLAGTSHAVFISTRPKSAQVSLRFFTTTGELPACGHGTVAALAYLAADPSLRPDPEAGRELHFIVNTAAANFPGRAAFLGRTATPARAALHERAGSSGRAALSGRVARREVVDGATDGGRFVEASFVPGAVTLREPSGGEYRDVVRSLGRTQDVDPVCVATLGRSRLLVRVLSRSALAALRPDFEKLRAACDRLDLLGCYAYCDRDTEGRAAARMFAPSIGVPEDIANANSTACLATYLASQGTTTLAVDMGDTLGSPATITTALRPTESGPELHVGGTTTIGPVIHL